MTRHFNKQDIARYALLVFAFSLPFSSALYRISILILCIILSIDAWGVFRRYSSGQIGSFIYQLRYHKILYLPVLLASWIFLSRIWSEASTAQYTYEVHRYVKLCMIPALAYLITRYAPSHHRQLLWAFLLGVVMLMLPTFVDAAGIFKLLDIDSSRFANGNYQMVRYGGHNLVYMRNQIVHGFMVSILCACLLTYYFTSDKKRLWLLVGALLCVIDILFFITARMALIGLIGSHVALLFHSKISARSKLIATGASLLLMGGLIVLYPNVQLRLISIYQEAYAFYLSHEPTTSGGIRLHYLSISWQLFTQHPLIGAGAGAFRDYLLLTDDPLLNDNHFHTHNEYMTLVSLYGLVGLSIFLLLLKEVFAKTLTLADETLKFVILGFLWIFLFNALTDSSLNNLWEGWSFVFFCGLLASLDSHFFNPTGRFEAN